MKNVRRACVLIAVLSAGAEPTRPAARDEPTTGKVLVLENERTMEGDVERVGTQYRIRHTLGTVCVPGERVLKLCPDVKAAYDYLRSRANLNDADERLRLAEWCRQHGLREQALAEVQEAVKLRPRDAVSRRLLDHLLQSQPVAEPTAKARPEPETPAAAVDLTADAMGLFATKVQPILMNTCAACHAADKGGKFKLTRNYESGAGNRKAMQQNLTAVLAQVNLREPRTSPLLTKAVSVHGPLAQAPLKNRQAPAYRTLEEWVRLTLANNPGLRETAPAAVPEAKAPPKTEASFAADSPPPAEPPANSPTAPTAAKPVAADPFDPADFNRQQARPDKRPPTPKKP